MARKKIFICFDYDNDRNYRYLLTALSKNPRSDIEFDDFTPDEIQSSNVGRIQAVLSGKIRDATHTLVIVGEHANSFHPNRKEIGTRNWQWWEIEKAAMEGKRFIAVKIEKSNIFPDPLLNQGATLASSYNVDSILKAIENA